MNEPNTNGDERGYPYGARTVEEVEAWIARNRAPKQEDAPCDSNSPA